jgi:hypothetical protein
MYQDLAFDLQPDDGHEAIIDPERQVLGEVAEPDRQLRAPQRGVALAPGRVGPHEGDHGGDYEQYAT